jgi:BirA family biotin operon repressor/biotin-[acetyl-CoA-carboxylase] ligase
LSEDWQKTRSVAAFFEELAICDSTNAELLGRRAPERFSVVVSRNQTDGRGRHGRSWLSAPDDSLAVSLFLGWDRSRSGDDASWIPLLAGVAAVEALEASTSASFGLKWPNDVLLENRKVGGILTQVHPAGGYVIGLGLNIRFSGLRPAPGAIAISEKIRIGEGFEDSFVSSFVLGIQKGIMPPTSRFPGIVRKHLRTLGERVRVHEIGKSSWEGKALGLGSRGELVVVNDEGREVRVQAADVWHVRSVDEA